jgi:subtilisin family serine protease
MVVSNAATLADRTRGGDAGLLGLGAVPGVTGAGIVVAVVDSGIAPHPALAGKVIANVSLVTGDPRVTDVFGHGGGRRESERLEAPFLGEVPLHVAIRDGGDAGRPIVAADPGSSLAAAFLAIADRVAAALVTSPGVAGRWA